MKDNNLIYMLRTGGDGNTAVITFLEIDLKLLLMHVYHFFSLIIISHKRNHDTNF
jgi:hypothetical protein